MTPSNKRQNQAKLLRTFREIHRKTGALLFVFFFVIALSGLFLGWKKHSNGLLLPQSIKGTSTNLKEWLPIDSLHQKACKIAHDSIDPQLSLELDRIDIRKDKGMVKFVFTDSFWEVQLDGATGNLLQVARRRSDFIETIHDGSFLDQIFGTSGGELKVVYSSVMGTALLIFTVTGFWLWYGPKRMRKQSKNSKE